MRHQKQFEQLCKSIERKRQESKLFKLMKEEIAEGRYCFNCDYKKDTCTSSLWYGRKVQDYNTCAGHSDGDDHLPMEVRTFNSKFLSEEMIKEARSLYLSDLSPIELAKKFDVPYNAMYQYLTDLVQTRKLKDEENELVDMMKLAGLVI